MSLDKVRLERAMNLSVTEGALATVMGTLLSGIFLTGFAMQLGATRLQIGILAALPTLCNAAQFAGASILHRTGRAKALCMLATWTSRLMWLPILLVPTCLYGWSGTDQAWCVIGLYTVASIFGSIGGLAWLDWIKRLIPEDQRISFLARRNWYNSGLSLAMSLTAALIISWWQPAATQSTGGFVTVFALAMGSGLLGVWLLGRIPAAEHSEPLKNTDKGRWREPLRSTNFRQLLAGYSVWQFASQMAAPFFAVYMLERLHVPFWVVTALATVGSLLGLALNGMWTRLKLRFGVRPVVLLATLGDLVIPLGWLCIHPQTLWLILPLHMLALFNPPLAMGPHNLLLKTAPNRNSPAYLALFNATTGMIGAMGAVAGGWLAMTLRGQWEIGQVELTGIQLVFLISACGKLAGFALLSRVEEQGATTLVEMLQFLLGKVRTARLVGHSIEQTPARREAA